MRLRAMTSEEHRHHLLGREVFADQAGMSLDAIARLNDPECIAFNFEGERRQEAKWQDEKIRYQLKTSLNG